MPTLPGDNGILPTGAQASADNTHVAVAEHLSDGVIDISVGERTRRGSTEGKPSPLLPFDAVSLPAQHTTAIEPNCGFIWFGVPHGDSAAVLPESRALETETHQSPIHDGLGRNAGTPTLSQGDWNLAEILRLPTLDPRALASYTWEIEEEGWPTPAANPPPRQYAGREGGNETSGAPKGQVTALLSEAEKSDCFTTRPLEPTRTPPPARRCAESSSPSTSDSGLQVVQGATVRPLEPDSSESGEPSHANAAPTVLRLSLRQRIALRDQARAAAQTESKPSGASVRVMPDRPRNNPPPVNWGDPLDDLDDQEWREVTSGRAARRTMRFEPAGDVLCDRNRFGILSALDGALETSPDLGPRQRVSAKGCAHVRQTTTKHHRNSRTSSVQVQNEARERQPWRERRGGKARGGKARCVAPIEVRGALVGLSGVVSSRFEVDPQRLEPPAAGGLRIRVFKQRVSFNGLDCTLGSRLMAEEARGLCTEPEPLFIHIDNKRNRCRVVSSSRWPTPGECKSGQIGWLPRFRAGGVENHEAGVMRSEQMASRDQHYVVNPEGQPAHPADGELHAGGGKTAARPPDSTLKEDQGAAGASEATLHKVWSHDSTSLRCAPQAVLKWKETALHKVLHTTTPFDSAHWRGATTRKLTHACAQSSRMPVVFPSPSVSTTKQGTLASIQSSNMPFVSPSVTRARMPPLTVPQDAPQIVREAFDGEIPDMVQLVVQFRGSAVPVVVHYSDWCYYEGWGGPAGVSRAVAQALHRTLQFPDTVPVHTINIGLMGRGVSRLQDWAGLVWLAQQGGTFEVFIRRRGGMDPARSEQAQVVSLDTLILDERQPWQEIDSLVSALRTG